MTCILVSPKDFQRIEGNEAYYFFPEATNEIIALEPVADHCAPEGRGYVMINGEYVKCVKLKFNSQGDPKK